MHFTPKIAAITTFAFACFCFISIILINVGGLSPIDYESSPSREGNKQFKLLTWNYTVTPTQSYQSYAYHVYLNHICTVSQRVSVADYDTNLVESECYDKRVLNDDYWFPAPNALVQELQPFVFDSVNLNAPFAFYIMAAFGAGLLLPYAVWLWFSKNVTRKAALVGLLMSGVCFSSFAVDIANAGPT